MEELTLLRIKPYKVAANSSKHESLRINLSPLCRFEAGTLVREVRRSSGVVELVPEDVFQSDEKYRHLR